MTEPEATLARELALEAARMRIPGGDVGAVLARTARRRRLRRLGRASSLCVVVALVAAMAVWRLQPDGTHPLKVATAASTLRRGDTGVVWRHGDSPNALGYVSTQTAGNSLYALSTAPGPAAPSSGGQTPKVLYRSGDGLDWTPVGSSSGDPFLADLSARADRLYAVGTGTASVLTTSGRPVADVAVSLSDDSARTWRRTMLGIDLAAIAAKATNVAVGSLGIAAGTHGVVAVVGITAQLDLAKVLPAGVEAPNGWAPTDTGIDILGASDPCPAGTGPRPGMPAPPTTLRPVAVGGPGQLNNAVCYRPDGSAVSVTPQQGRGVDRSFTWAALGVGGDLLRAVQATPMAFWSADGVSFERVDAPLAHLSSLRVTAVGDGFAIAAQRSAAGSSSAVVLGSVDGRKWSTDSAPIGLQQVSALGQAAGHIALVGGGAEPSVAILDGGTWRTGRLADVMDPAVLDKASLSLTAAAIGPLGVVAVMRVQPDAVAVAGGVTVAAGSYTLHILNERWTGFVTDGAGRESARADDIRTASAGVGLRYDPLTQTVTMLDRGGAELARFPGQAIIQAMRSVSAASPPPATYQVLFSRDGTTWSSQPLAQLVDGPIARIGDVLVTDSKVVVTAIPPGANAPPDHATVVVGTV